MTTLVTIGTRTAEELRKKRRKPVNRTVQPLLRAFTDHPSLIGSDSPQVIRIHWAQDWILLDAAIKCGRQPVESRPAANQLVNRIIWFHACCSGSILSAHHSADPIHRLLQAFAVLIPLHRKRHPD